ncbi:hypothetical protein QA612_12830 [Evansella sp. AB-P1]|uniref:hypothetical protein n=1 Tax=Evansella sp. AB-P1 TaxID=3037653 RepID=UPI00241F37B6|nr:hypothetical protein [Evansella sp. AB-P1]MDG5788366.1 hypothetical protein [Evansella sp. AB-P1]
MRKMHYYEIKEQLKTGDIILFSGQYKISKLVEKLEHSDWSHVGMVVRPDPKGEIYFFESTALTNLEDELFHDNKTGPKLVKLYDRLKTYGEDLTPYVPPLYAVRSIVLTDTSIDETILYNYINKVHGIPNPNQWEMIWEVLEGRFLHISSKKSDYTCSKLVAELYEKLGLFKPKLPLNGYMPKDFSSNSGLKLEGAYLEEEVVIQLDEEKVI